MIKGVNRQVLEVHDTGVECFEKALFFVKPEYSTMSETTLREKALEAFGENAKVPQTRRGKWKYALMRIGFMLCAAASGAAITAIVTLIR